MIDIDKLTEAELVDLNHRIVARIRMLREVRAHQSMLEFRIGDRISFQPDGYPQLYGIIVRYNRKSVSVVTDEGSRWNVAPSLLRRVPSTGGANENDEDGDIRLFDSI